MLKFNVLFINFINNSRYFTQRICENSTTQNNDPNYIQSFFARLGNHISIPNSKHRNNSPIQTYNIKIICIFWVKIVKLNPIKLKISYLIISK